MARRFFSGTTLEQAVLEAARNYDTEPERIAYRERERRHGFVNLRRKVVIEVDPEKPTLPDGEEVPWRPKLAGVPSGFDASRSNEAAPPSGATPGNRGSEAAPPAKPASPAPEPHAREPREPVRQEAESREVASREVASREAESREAASREVASREPVSGDEEDERDGFEETEEDRSRGGPGRSYPPRMEDPLDAADDALGEIADLLLFDMEWEIEQDADGSLSVELAGEDSDAILAEDARIMRAVEHLLPRLIRGRYGRTLQVRVDCKGFQAGHEEELHGMARRAAEEVLESGRSKLLEPMPPADRRLIHVALADDERVDTESEGEGFTKRVRVRPT